MNHGCTAVLRNILLAEAGVNRTLFAVEIEAEVIIHLIGVGADGERADFQNHLVAAAGVDGAGGEHHLKTRL